MSKPLMIVVAIFILLAFSLNSYDITSQAIQSSQGPTLCPANFCGKLLNKLDNIAESMNRGTIVIRESDSSFAPGLPVYVALPKGNCEITVNNNFRFSVAEAKDVSTTRNPQSCLENNEGRGCSFTVNIDDEYYMIVINFISGNYQYMHVSYFCSNS